MHRKQQRVKENETEEYVSRKQTSPQTLMKWRLVSYLMKSSNSSHKDAHEVRRVIHDKSKNFKKKILGSTKQIRAKEYSN